MKWIAILIIGQLLITASIAHSIQNHSNDTYKHETFEYIIICPEKFSNNFNRLVEYKSHFITSKLITIEEIVSDRKFWVNGLYGDATNISNGNLWILDGKEVTYNLTLFNDTQAKIRNFIRYAHDTLGTQYVLLGGDFEHLPSKRLYCWIQNWTNTVKIKPIESFIVSDHYFAALNGSWNPDEDDRFGEETSDSIEEEADFSQEIYIGRAPVNDKNDVNVFVQKVITYETSKKPFNIQFQQSYIQPNQIPDTVPVAEMCTPWIPDTYSIHRLYERDGMVTTKQWVDTFQNQNTLVYYQIGNGYNDELFSWYQLSWKGSRRNIFSVLDVGQLQNSFHPIHLSISCQTSDFSENECLAEELLLTQKGGASACIGNTEVGCLNKTDATRYSAEFFERIFYELFENKTENLGKILKKAKDPFIDSANSVQQYRWCLYELVLLGDPETPVLETREKPEDSSLHYFVDDDFNPDHYGWNVTHFSSIQSAINQIEEFGTIWISPGTYYEHICINKTLSIRGFDKTDTILTNRDTRPIIILQCHSTIIQNLTLRNSIPEDTPYPESLISIENGCNGNHIEHNIIEGKASYGILLKDSIRNHIIDNTVQDTICGIGIINTMEGLLPTTVIVTCDNMISQNIIQRNQQCGIYIESSIHNYITHNVFLENGAENEIVPFSTNDNNICLVKTKLNTINGNYWEKPYQTPYRIWANHGPITIFTVDISKGLLFKYYKCILILNLGIPFPVYDYHPAMIP